MIADQHVMFGFDIKFAIECVESFASSCNVGCMILDDNGHVIYKANTNSSGCVSCKFCDRLSQITGNRPLCASVHADSGRQAERFGGRYIYFCPKEMVFFSSAIAIGKKTLGTLIGGPVMLIGTDEYIADEIIHKHELDPNFYGEFLELLKPFAVVSPTKLGHMSSMLFILAAHLGGAERSILLSREIQQSQQSGINEHIQELKKSNNTDFYPIETEKELMSAIGKGDRGASLALINELLGHIFFRSGEDIALIQIRITEILALISRAAIYGGAEPELILSLNYRYSTEIRKLSSIEDIAYWLAGVITRFTDLVFHMIDVNYKDIVYKATNYINLNYMNKITLEQVACYVNISSSHFSKVFKSATGRTFSSYLNELRIAKSKTMLLSGDTPLSEISQMSGFEDQSYFTKIFKKHTGVTPKKYREFRGKPNTSRERSR